jgi:hypothetical protein
VAPTGSASRGSSAAAGAADSSATSSCPAKGEGGPFVRLCAESEFTNAPNVAGAIAEVTLPCTTSDFKKRDYYDVNPKTKKGTKVKGPKNKDTTDAGYIYFATYAPGPSQELEVGFEHNWQLPGALGKSNFNGYSFYVRHGPDTDTGFWNQAPKQAVLCTDLVPEYMMVFLLYSPGSSSIIIQAAFESAALNHGYNYTFESSASAKTVTPTSNSLGNGSVDTSTGRGKITPLNSKWWGSGCSGCNVAMITAIAQNVPKVADDGKVTGSTTRTDPVEDGASFGPVSWGDVMLLDGGTVIQWTEDVTASELEWKKGTIITGNPAVKGDPPNYSVPKVAVRCKASKTGNDRWTC